MAGRPRTMMERVRALYAAADALYGAIADVVPQQYRDRGARADALAQAWLDAEDDALDTFVSLDSVLEHLSEKVASAGDDAAAKATDILALWTKPKGPWPSETESTPQGL